MGRADHIRQERLPPGQRWPFAVSWRYGPGFGMLMLVVMMVAFIQAF